MVHRFIRLNPTSCWTWKPAQMCCRLEFNGYIRSWTRSSVSIWSWLPHQTWPVTFRLHAFTSGGGVDSGQWKRWWKRRWKRRWKRWWKRWWTGWWWHFYKPRGCKTCVHSSRLWWNLPVSVVNKISNSSQNMMFSSLSGIHHAWNQAEHKTREVTGRIPQPADGLVSSSALDICY